MPVELPQISPDPQSVDLSEPEQIFSLFGRAKILDADHASIMRNKPGVFATQSGEIPRKASLRTSQPSEELDKVSGRKLCRASWS